MGVRRGRGEGSYARRANGTYRLRVYVGADKRTGRPIQASRTVRVRTDTEARRELRRFLAEVDEGRVAVPGPRATVGVLLDAWLAHLRTAGRAPSTIETYTMVADVHLRPALGRLSLRALSAHDLDVYYGQRLEAGLSAQTVRHHHVVISAALAQAVRWGWLAVSPAKMATPPSRPRRARRVPTVAEVRRLLDAAADDPELSAGLALAALTGARRGELCGLRWEDVDWQAGVLRVERQRVPLAGGDRTGPVKRGEGRTVTLGALGVEVLRRYRAAVDERAEQSAVEADRDGWLLSRDGGWTPLRPSWLGETVRALGKTVGVDVTMHDFRRFAATQMVGAGVDVRTAAGRLGHTPEMLLRVYAGFLPSRDAAAAELLGSIVAGVSR